MENLYDLMKLDTATLEKILQETPECPNTCETCTFRLDKICPPERKTNYRIALDLKKRGIVLTPSDASHEHGDKSTVHDKDTNQE